MSMSGWMIWTIRQSSGGTVALFPLYLLHTFPNSLRWHSEPLPLISRSHEPHNCRPELNDLDVQHNLLASVYPTRGAISCRSHHRTRTSVNR